MELKEIIDTLERMDSSLEDSRLCFAVTISAKAPYAVTYYSPSLMLKPVDLLNIRHTYQKRAAKNTPAKPLCEAIVRILDLWKSPPSSLQTRIPNTLSLCHIVRSRAGTLKGIPRKRRFLAISVILSELGFAEHHREEREITLRILRNACRG